MGAFNTTAILNGNPNLIPTIAEHICRDFSADGYECKQDNLLNGGVDISLTRGGFFKAVLGMKTALKITLIPPAEGISFEAGIGIFGQQAIPTIIMLFFAWPVLLTQIWGLVQQSKLDDKALSIAQSVIAESSSATPFTRSTQSYSSSTRFCTYCGTRLSSDARFCSPCGKPLE
ncbi:MAG: zinc ribbon domain-containing protein [Duncaniella sp.]|nr:zinc ribbon domain-containing protein [Duncaniella sp.]